MRLLQEFQLVEIPAVRTAKGNAIHKLMQKKQFINRYSFQAEPAGRAQAPPAPGESFFLSDPRFDWLVAGLQAEAADAGRVVAGLAAVGIGSIAHTRPKAIIGTRFDSGDGRDFVSSEIQKSLH